MPEVHGSTAGLSDVGLYYSDTGGGGRPVVLIHAWPLSGDMWYPNVPALQVGGHRVITYDRRGFGRSEKPLNGYDYDHLADDLAMLLTELDLHEVTLVGYSMGAGEVCRYIARHGHQRLRGVVLAAAITPYFHRSRENPAGTFTSADADAASLALSRDRHAFLDDVVTQFYSDEHQLKITEEQRQRAVAQALRAAAHALPRCMDAFGFTDFRQDLTELTMPTLIIHGDQDNLVPLAASAALTHRAIPASRLHVIAGGTHGINVSHVDEFNHIMLDFVDGLG